MLNALKSVLADFAGMVTAPRTTLRRIADGTGASALWPILALLFVTVLGNAKVLSRFALLMEHGAETMMKRVREVLTRDLRTDAIVLVVTCVVVAALAQVLSKGRVRPADAATAAAWLVVPLVLLKALGGVLDTAGLDVWFLPQTAVDSSSVIVKGDVDWMRFAVKCVTAYGVPLVLGLSLLTSFVRPAPADAAAATPVALSGLRARLGLGIVALVLVGFTAFTVVDVVRHADRIRPVLPGDTLPEIALRELTVDGVSKKKIALQSFTGQVLVLDFWASWCNPCRRSMPELSVIYDELKDKGLVVLGVNREPQDPKAAAKALRDIAPHFPSVIDDRFFGERLGLTTLPTSYVLDRKGIVRHFHMGYVEPAQIRGEIEALLSEP